MNESWTCLFFSLFFHLVSSNWLDFLQEEKMLGIGSLLPMHHLQRYEGLEECSYAWWALKFQVQLPCRSSLKMNLGLIFCSLVIDRVLFTISKSLLISMALFSEIDPFFLWKRCILTLDLLVFFMLEVVFYLLTLGWYVCVHASGLFSF